MTKIIKLNITICKRNNCKLKFKIYRRFGIVRASNLELRVCRGKIQAMAATSVPKSGGSPTGRGDGQQCSWQRGAVGVMIFEG